MFSIFKNKETVNFNNIFVKIASLLIHAAKIDEIYTEIEKEIIKKTIISLGASKNEIDNIVNDAEKNESKSIQMIEFTKDIKKLDENDKKKIVEALWKIIYSDNKSDIYEANLMRRLTGLLYLDSRVVGDIKVKIKSELKNDIFSK